MDVDAARHGPLLGLKNHIRMPFHGSPMVGHGPGLSSLDVLLFPRH
jgi:hypothetical protein